jgi:CBS domain-containing protein
MSERKIGCLPVLDPGTKKVAGIITESDMLRLLSRMLKQKGT